MPSLPAWGLNRPARPMFYVPLAQNVAYTSGDMMQRVELRSHFISGIMLATNAPAGRARTGSSPGPGRTWTRT